MQPKNVCKFCLEVRLCCKFSKKSQIAVNIKDIIIINYSIKHDRFKFGKKLTYYRVRIKLFEVFLRE